MLALFLPQAVLTQNALTQNPDGFSIGPIALLITVAAVIIAGFLYRAKQDRKEQPAAAVSTPAVARPVGKTVVAPGSFGEIRLQNVDDRIAAMLMAIVADELKTPLNQLRFLSIRQLKEGK